MPRLRIARAELAAIVAHARRAAPDEACGVLVGWREEADIIVERVVPTTNAHAEPRAQYLVAPEELLRATLMAEDEWGLDVVGFYHSHPQGPPFLSPTDVARASWPGAAHLLVWLAPEDGVGAWRWDDGARRFDPLTIVEG